MDTGKVEGHGAHDVNGNVVIADTQKTFPITPFSNDMPVNYRYHYESYSGIVSYWKWA